MSLGLTEWETPPKDSTTRIVFSWFYDRLEKVSVLRKFIRTHRALTEGHALYEESDEQLDKLKLFKPLAFNFYQSTLSAIPGIFLAAILGFFFVPDGNSLNAPLSPGILEQRASRLFEKISPSVVAFAAPIGLLIFSRMAAWSSLRREQRSTSSLWKQRRAYLYFDAHSGLLTQAVLSLLMSAQRFAIENPAAIQRHNLLGWLLEGAGGFTGWASLFQLAVTCSMVPSQLFALAGYSSIIRGVASGAQWVGTPPKGQYIFWTVCIAPVLVSILYCALLLASYFVALGGAWLQGVTSGATSP